eukprot:1814291-Rhodomonas_salina.1
MCIRDRCEYQHTECEYRTSRSSCEGGRCTAERENVGLRGSMGVSQVDETGGYRVWMREGGGVQEEEGGSGASKRMCMCERTRKGREAGG